MQKFIRRLFRQVGSSLANRRVWLLSGISLLGTIAGELVKDRFYSGINKWLEDRKDKIMEFAKPMLLWILDHPPIWPILVFTGIILHAYRRSLQEQERSPVLSLSVAVAPSSVSVSLEKPQHNVKFVGFKFIHDEPFRIAALRFQNVPTPGKLMGKFESPRLRVIYYEGSTGQEIADMCPIIWWDDKDGVIDISADGRDADLASYFEGKWTASEQNEPADNYDSWHQLNSVELPVGEIRIEAYLTGQYGLLSIPKVTGVFTLNKDGSASFTQG